MRITPEGPLKAELGKTEGAACAAQITNDKLQMTNELQITNFENINETQIKNLAKILQSSIRKLKKIHATNPHYAKKAFGYNFYIFVPSHPKGDQTQPVIPSEVEESFYLRIIPRFMERAGFELSTGIMVNSVSPEKAAEELKKTIL